MAFDGIFLSRIKDEIEARVLGLRVEKIQQPSRDEIVLVFRGKGGAHRVLLNVSSGRARIHFTSQQPENPAAPPMFCMLLRKHLSSAKLVAVRQLGLDRILFLDFDATNEIGDRVKRTLCLEIMGTYSNLILISGENKILDSAKRIDYASGASRHILPGLVYELPAQQEKLCLETESEEAVFDRILNQKNKLLSSAALFAVQGISPVIAREIAFRVCGNDLCVGDLDEAQKETLIGLLRKIKQGLHHETAAFLVPDEAGQPKDLAFLEILQYGSSRVCRRFETASLLLDCFFSESDRVTRLHQRGRELLKTVSNHTERTIRKLALQKKELEACADRETLRLYGELITANLHRLQKGSVFYDVENYYDGMRVLRIAADPAKTPLENANRYYKDYRKAQTAERILTEQIAAGEAELGYLESVSDALSRAETAAELDLIREELAEQGYLKRRGAKKQKQTKPLPPLEFETTDGYRVFVGRNNLQNDRLSLKIANRADLWLHVQGFAGSHVIVENQGGAVSDQAIEEAAVIAATFSKAADSSLVPVDYTPAGKLKKPSGAKPGKVIYHEYHTILVKPDKHFCEERALKKG